MQLYQMPSWSGLQKDVLSLYRRALRMVRSKPPATQPKFRLFVRFTFHTNANKVSPRNISFIEHLLRKGVRQIEAYEDPAVKDCWVSEEMLSWDNDMRKAVKSTFHKSAVTV